MKNTSILILFLTALSCGQADNQTSNIYSFDKLTEDYLQVLWQISPEYASYMGLSQYDSMVTLNTTANIEKNKRIADSLLAVLESYPIETLSDLDKIDLYMMKDLLYSNEWYGSSFKSHEWNPAQVNIGNKIGLIMNRTDSMENKLKSLSAVLTKAPEYYQVGLKNLKTPSKPHLDLTIKQNKGTLNYLTSIEITVAEAAISDDEKDALSSKIGLTKAAVESFVNEIEMMEKEGNYQDSRIEETFFEEKYEHDINSAYTAKEIYEKALSEKAELHRQMITISDTLWNKYLPADAKPKDSLLMVKQLIDKISEKHVSKDSFFIEINRQIKELAAFVDEKDLLTQDPTKPLQVRETPEYMRGVAGASISAPGPFEEDGITFYNVTPLDHYDEAQAESYLREYNAYILQILNIHEAIPGHYTQLVYSNKSKSLIKSILQNGAMIEGWANYTEIMMLEEGYNNSPEMWLMRNKWHLRGVTNTILDYSYHVLGLTREEAMDLMMDGAFQEQTEAEGKWVRLTVSSVQLSSYFTGFTQIYDLREEVKARKGDDFNLKEFHEEFLSYGSAPVKYIRQFMLN
ncbi:MAG: DUF885 domain-containing protein [Cyclobacteriaceae bacterium]